MTRAGMLPSLPVSLFGSVMGLSGLTLGWRLAHVNFGAPKWIATIVALLAVLDFIVLLVAYTFKCWRYWPQVVDEFRHPVSGNFFGTFPIAVLLISVVLRPLGLGMSETLWIIGTLLTLAMAYWSVTGFFAQARSLDHATPAWIIPGVGVLDIPVTSAGLPWGAIPQIDRLGFAIGAVWALILIVLIIGRHVVRGPVAPPLVPSLAILFAPFPVAFLGYETGLAGPRPDDFAATLFYFGLFLFLGLVPHLARRGLPFGPSWWALSFPMAAMANSALIYSRLTPGWGLAALATALLIGVTLAIGWILVKSLAHPFWTVGRAQ